MEKKRKPPGGGNDDLGAVVDQLLKKLPHADPTSAARRTPAAKPRELGTLHRSGPPSAGPPATPAGAWARLALGIVFGIALTQWPYDTSCGFPAFLYLGAVAVVVLAALWSTIISWKLHMALAHVGALLLLAWGGVLAAQDILPRVGYARAEASWTCGTRSAEQAAPTSTDLPTAPPIVVEDSLGPIVAVPESLAASPDSMP